jgi:hypothetical protein
VRALAIAVEVLSQRQAWFTPVADILGYEIDVQWHRFDGEPRCYAELSCPAGRPTFVVKP